MTADPVDWAGVEQAIWYWVTQSTGIPGDRVRNQQPRDSGEAKGPGPKATISLISILPTSMQMRETQPRVMQQRYTVTSTGPGVVGVDFYAGRSTVAQPISIAAGIGDLPTTSAAALLVELSANLPAGYTATADPEDTASVLVDGSEAEPLFAAAPVDPAFLAVTTPIPRFPYIDKVEHRAVWRVSFRAAGVNGRTMAANAMAQAMTYRRSLLDPAMLKVGFRRAGWAGSQPFVPVDRSESLATLDPRFIGLMTGAEAATALRVTRTTLEAQPAA